MPGIKAGRGGVTELPHGCNHLSVAAIAWSGGPGPANLPQPQARCPSAETRHTTNTHQGVTELLSSPHLTQLLASSHMRLGRPLVTQEGVPQPSDHLKRAAAAYSKAQTSVPLMTSRRRNTMATIMTVRVLAKKVSVVSSQLLMGGAWATVGTALTIWASLLP